MRETVKADSAERPAAAESSTPRSFYLAAGALALMSLVWGYSWVVMKVALDYAEASVFAALRMFLAAVFLFLVSLALRRPLRPQSVRLTLGVGLCSAASTGLMTWALESGGAGKTSVLVYTMPLWLILISWVVLKERMRGPQWLSVALSLAGLCFILSPWNMQGSLLSNVLAVAAGVSWALSNALIKKLSGKRHVDILSLNAWQLLVGSIPLAIIALATSDSDPVWSGSFIAALLFNVILTSSLGALLWFFALRTLPAGTAGLATLATPVLGVAFAWIQLGERPNLYEAAGMVLIVSALGLLALQQIVMGRRTSRMKEIYYTEADSPWGG